MNGLDKKIRFSNVATAIDLTPKAFRNWLQRYELNLLSDHKTRGWTEFTMGDVAVLAVTRELVRWGVGVEDANMMAYIVLSRKAELLLEYRNTPADALLAALQRTVFFLHSPGHTDGPFLVTEPQDEGFSESQHVTSLRVDAQKCVANAFAQIDSTIGTWIGRV
ncbi:hypothetical protein GLP59_06610 [Sulfitobacter sp. M220]|uniref:hypothetical protein n=1 Tax=unclassified Sulfitobacter TaxID=196795 RepID=UPI0004E2CD47|nr:MULTISPECIES: hypothetical protein [unclassified Sulfitobacter]MCF7777325.1 hypothetical protein [Sulfitobacter sp. M220]PTA98974.1 hypothetical protein C8254_10970 [Sulfitobacter sp. CB-A]ULO18904.1 hypothetical protein IV89_001886 [Sulfitobacter sp. CB2047]